MRPSDPHWAERFIALTGLAWIVLSLGVGLLVGPRLHGFAPLSSRPLFGLHFALGVLALCLLARRHATARSAARHIPALAAAMLVLLAVDGQIVGFHARSPSPWECAALCSAASIVAYFGGRLLRSRSTSR